MSDIQAIRAERDRAQLACQQIAERLTASEARAEAAEAILQQMLTAEVEYSEGIPCGYGPPVYTALELAIMAREALDALKGTPDGR